jgi:glycosyltransferase involved in cell wall biosynthesis
MDELKDKYMDTIEEQLINAYNTPDSVVMISTYPERFNGSIKNLNAVASYSGHLAQYLPAALATQGKKLIIICQTDGEPSIYEEHGILIYRCWRKETPDIYIHILNALRSFYNVSSVFTQFEFHEFGGNTETLTFPLFLGAVKLMGKNITLLMHQVVTDITTLSKHVDILPGTLKAFVFNRAIRLFYFISGNIADKVIVHDDILAQRLTMLTGRHDIITIPHGLGAIKQTIPRRLARKKLGIAKGEFAVMSFGFFTWYKGTDWLISHWKTIAKGKNMKLILAGGESPNVKDKPHYQAFMKKINHYLNENRNIQVTGFIEDRDIPLYFAACDVVVLPYRTLMSSSGPLAMSIAFRKPFILSHVLLPYAQDADFQNALAANHVPIKELSFSLSNASLLRTLDNVKLYRGKFRRVSATLYESRNWEAVSQLFAQAINHTVGYPRVIRSVIIKAKQLYAYAPLFGSSS